MQGGGKMDGGVQQDSSSLVSTGGHFSASARLTVTPASLCWTRRVQTPTGDRPCPAPGAHLDSVAHVVQHAVVDGLADVAHRPLGVGRSDDLVRA